MEEITRFLLEHPPFAQLGIMQVQRLAGSIRIEYFGAGAPILTQGSRPAEYLYIVRRGSVDMLVERDDVTEVIDTIGEGEMFGYVSLLRGKEPILTCRAREATLAYLLPAATFHQLRRDYPVFAQYFARSVVERLEQALEVRHAEAAPELFQTRLRDVARRPLLTIAPTASVRDAAAQMRSARVSSLVVPLAQGGQGIITDHDLRSRVMAEGLGYDTPVAQVMSTPALTIHADSLVFEGLLTMIERGIHHLPVVEDGRLIGMVTYADILRRQSNSPLLLPRQLRRARDDGDLRAYTDQVAATVGALLEAGARVSDIGRAVAVAHDALHVHLLQQVEAALGPPPCPYAWLVLGSEGRAEQTLRTDQDNALIYADDAPPEAADYFAALAGRMVEQLVRCGFPRCPGNIMATNPQWRQPLNIWQGYFRQWISVPDEEALLQTAIFFDYRQIHGELAAEPALRAIIRRANERRVFLGRLARAGLRQRPPLNVLRQLVLERRGEQRGLIDLKYRGTAMIVDLGRLYALETGLTETNTIVRLRRSAAASSLGEAGAEELVAAFELIGLLRLRWQYQQLRRGEPPTNQVEVSRLSPLERRELKEALHAVATAQRGVEVTYQTALIA